MVERMLLCHPILQRYTYLPQDPFYIWSMGLVISDGVDDYCHVSNASTSGNTPTSNPLIQLSLSDELSQQNSYTFVPWNNKNDCIQVGTANDDCGWDGPVEETEARVISTSLATILKPKGRNLLYIPTQHTQMSPQFLLALYAEREGEKKTEG